MSTKGQVIEGSSLKNFNFTGWTADQILQKYESVLESREKQITDLTVELGALNETLSSYIDKCSNYVEENDVIKTKFKKKEALLTQELANKEILFMKLDRKEVECDELIKRYNELLKAKNTSSSVNQQQPKQLHQQVEYSKVNEVNEIISSGSGNSYKMDYGTISDKGNLSSEVGGNTNFEGHTMTGIGTTEPQKSIKTKARNRIEQLKTKTNNATKINFSNLFDTKTEQAKEEKANVEENTATTTTNITKPSIEQPEQQIINSNTNPDDNNTTKAIEAQVEEETAEEKEKETKIEEDNTNTTTTT